MIVLPFFRSTADVCKMFLLICNLSLAFLGVSSFFVATGFFLNAEETGKLFPIALFYFGIFATLLGSFGSFSLHTSKKQLLKTYFLLLFVLLMLQIVFLVTVYFFRHKDESFYNLIWGRLYNEDPVTIDQIENLLECCGFNNIFDRQVPLSCSFTKKFQRSCFSVIQSEKHRISKEITHFLFFIISAQLLALIAVFIVLAWLAYRQYIIDKSNMDWNRLHNYTPIYYPAPVATTPLSRVPPPRYSS